MTRYSYSVAGSSPLSVNVVTFRLTVVIGWKLMPSGERSIRVPVAGLVLVKLLVQVSVICVPPDRPVPLRFDGAAGAVAAGGNRPNTERKPFEPAKTWPLLT